MLNNHRRAFTLTETAATLAILVALSATALPAITASRGRAMRQVSLENLRNLAVAQSCYAGDWAGRQFTAVPDDLGAFGDGCFDYENANGYYPPLLLGYNAGDPSCEQDLVGMYAFWPTFCNNVLLTRPLNLDPAERFGVFRLPNVWPLHAYNGAGTGRVYDPVYWAPDDEPAVSIAESAFDLPCEFVPAPVLDDFPPPSYVFSPAAMYHPDVFRRVADGGFRDPFSFDEGFTSPAEGQVRFPDLKTRLIEHNWIDGAPGPCNPAYEDAFEVAGCSPYLFNHGADAAPATLFFDGSTTLLSTGQVVADDERLLELTGGVDGLWSRDTPFGPTGWYGDASFDGTVVSHHVLTTDGILGRDRLELGGVGAARGGRRAR